MHTHTHTCKMKILFPLTLILLLIFCFSLFLVLQLEPHTYSDVMEGSLCTHGRPTTDRAHELTDWLSALAPSRRMQCWLGWTALPAWETTCSFRLWVLHKQTHTYCWVTNVDANSENASFFWIQVKIYLIKWMKLMNFKLSWYLLQSPFSLMQEQQAAWIPQTWWSCYLALFENYPVS